MTTGCVETGVPQHALIKSFRAFLPSATVQVSAQAGNSGRVVASLGTTRCSAVEEFVKEYKGLSIIQSNVPSAFL